MKVERLLLVVLLLVAALFSVACSDSTVGTNNSPPEVTVLLPETGFTATEGLPILFEGRATDRGTNADDLEMRWSSSLDGLLLETTGDSEGVSTFTTDSLTLGQHDITLRAIDSVGAAATDTIEVTVTPNEPPNIEIVGPTVDGIYYLDYPVG